jgi:branched-chain amino acid transport system permease protein
MSIALGILLNGLASAMILYIIAVGLSVTMGIMRFINLAHGVFAMAGGYLAAYLIQSAGVPFAAAIVLAALVIALASIPIERLLYAPLYRASELEQTLFSIGVMLVAVALAQFLFGPTPLTFTVPKALRGQIDLGSVMPTYRIVIILVGFVIFGSLWVLVETTNIGRKLRATVENRRIAEVVGIRSDRLMVLTFALGTGLAAFGGAIGADIMPIRPNYAFDQLNFVLIVVTVGGMGTIAGPFVAALLLGIVDAACKYFLPEIGAFFIFAAMVAILLWRPHGLLGHA